ncbi:PREDICTED: fibulin-1 [Cyprinodon variegatus]|uniref:fibulin-1 n=1 Tax=Cyprinodon variegatus TaxID=28743 RepID=UPI0007428F3A|nr:PREDICTED: fibulin-1 [Cyprinodon variegatus]
MGFSCEFDDLQIDRQCLEAAKMCCEKPKEIEILPTTEAPGETNMFTTRPPVEATTCKELKCSQLCVDNSRCACKEGFRLKQDGVTCEDIDECLTGGHNCTAEQVCSNSVGSFYCRLSCHPGFTLTDNTVCKDIDECAIGSHDCGADYVCINTVGSFSCEPKVVCEDGFTHDTAGKCIDIDECTVFTYPCRPGEKCINTVGSYSCQRNSISCPQGYRPSADGTKCEDEDECLTGKVCGNHVCVNLEGSYRCECGAGYQLSNTTKLCEDINECKHYYRQPCGQICENTEGSYKCKCVHGFRLGADGLNCDDIDECALGSHDCRGNYVCINTPGSFYCRPKVPCRNGYAPDAAGKCIDVNECLSGNNCGSHVCVNLDGSYRCECRKGYLFNRVTKMCEDINECMHYSGRLCAHKCENTEGSYRCSCATGFKLSNNGRDCEDVNECLDKPCSQECTNVYGSYQCYCHHGYQLNDIDGVTCEDIDECKMPNVCSYKCINTPGGFNCTCPTSGYTLARDGRTCQDIDECAAGTHSCSSTETCFNVQGGFRCVFFDCPTNFRRAAEGSTGKDSALVHCIKNCQGWDTACNRDPVHIITSTALSLPTFQYLEEPEEIIILWTATEAKPDLLPDEPNVFFEILATDELRSFDVIKRSQNGMIVGVIRQIKPVMGPKELVLEVNMKYLKAGVISQQNVILIHVYISKYWF